MIFSPPYPETKVVFFPSPDVEVLMDGLFHLGLEAAAGIDEAQKSLSELRGNPLVEELGLLYTKDTQTGQLAETSLQMTVHRGEEIIEVSAAAATLAMAKERELFMAGSLVTSEKAEHERGVAQDLVEATKVTGWDH